METQEEVWKPITGYEGLYEVSSIGRVRSLTRMCTDVNGKVRPIEGKILNQDVKRASKDTTNLYKRVTLTTHGKSVHKSVHRLVAEAFINNDAPNVRTQVNHKDGDKTNNSVDNLEWCTSSENIRHSLVNNLAHPNPPKGEKAVLSKLSNKDVGIARELYELEQFTVDELAAMHHVGTTTMLNAIRGHSYKEADDIHPPCKRHKSSTGSMSPHARLTADNVEDIKARLHRGETQCSVANLYKVSNSTIWRIAHNLRYNE